MHKVWMYGISCKTCKTCTQLIFVRLNFREWPAKELSQALNLLEIKVCEHLIFENTGHW